MPIQLAVALGLALLLDKGMRGLPLYRSIFYLPSLLGGSVAVAILWRQVFGKDGIFNGFLSIFGIDGPGWIGHPDFALGTIIILHVWTFGSPMVIFLAGLRQIPEMFYEASAVDGAGRIRRFVSITLPLLTPIIFFNLVLQIIFAFQTFTQAYVVSGRHGRPGGFDDVLHALPLPHGVPAVRHGLRLGDGLVPVDRDRGVHRVQLLALEVLGVL